jgi:hypothetical protein
MYYVAKGSGIQTFSAVTQFFTPDLLGTPLFLVTAAHPKPFDTTLTSLQLHF